MCPLGFRILPKTSSKCLLKIGHNVAIVNGGHHNAVNHAAVGSESDHGTATENETYNNLALFVIKEHMQQIRTRNTPPKTYTFVMLTTVYCVCRSREEMAGKILSWWHLLSFGFFSVGVLHGKNGGRLMVDMHDCICSLVQSIHLKTQYDEPPQALTVQGLTL